MLKSAFAFFHTVILSTLIGPGQSPEQNDITTVNVCVPYLLLETTRSVVIVVHSVFVCASSAQVDVVGVKLRRRGSVRGGRAFSGVRTG